MADGAGECIPRSGPPGAPEYGEPAGCQGAEPLGDRFCGANSCKTGAVSLAPGRTVDILAPMSSSSPNKIILAYSGGLDTSVILTWLKEQYGCEVVAFCADVGQGEELGGLDEKAKATGASKCVIADIKEEFVSDFVFPMLRANAVYEGDYLLGTSIARPVIAKAMMEVAAAEGANAISHGATGKGNDQVRFELTAMAIDPRIQIIAPWRTWDLRSRTDCMAYAQKHSIPVSATVEKPYSIDRNLLHISFEGGILEDPWRAPEEAMFVMTTSPEDAPDAPAEVVVSFEQGTPVAVDGESLTPARLLARLNALAGAHGVGRVDMVRAHLHTPHREFDPVELRRHQSCCSRSTAPSST